MKFSEIHSELLFYLEDKVVHNVATEEELVLYEEYKKYKYVDIDSEICQTLIEEMQSNYKNGYSRGGD